MTPAIFVTFLIAVDRGGLVIIHHVNISHVTGFWLDYMRNSGRGSTCRTQRGDFVRDATVGHET